MGSATCHQLGLEETHLKELGGVIVQVLALRVGRDAGVELADLVVLGRLAFMGPVRVTRHDVAGCLPGRFGFRRVKARCAAGRVGGRVAIGELH